MRALINALSRGYARALEHKGESIDALITRAAIAKGASISLDNEGFRILSVEAEGEVSGYYDLMRVKA